MKTIHKLICIALVTVTLFLSGCTPPADQIDPFLWVKALPGDGTVSIQWWLTDSTLLYQGGKFGHFKLMRASGGGDFEEIAEFGPTTPLYAGWCWTDSTVENETEYKYYVQAIFAIFETPEAEGFSDTFTVTPQAGLSDPRPPAPDSFTFDPLLDGSEEVTLRWVPPPGHDSLYYVFLAFVGTGFYIYHENYDGSGREWDPSGTQVDPVELDSASYTFLCNRDGDTRYYKIAAFKDSIMSYPSQELEIEHSWQPQF